MNGSVAVVIQGWVKMLAPGLMNFVPAVAYHFCLNFPEKILSTWGSLLAQPCNTTLALSRMFPCSAAARTFSKPALPLPDPRLVFDDSPASRKGCFYSDRNVRSVSGDAVRGIPLKWKMKMSRNGGMKCEVRILASFADLDRSRTRASRRDDSSCRSFWVAMKAPYLSSSLSPSKTLTAYTARLDRLALQRRSRKNTPFP